MSRNDRIQLCMTTFHAMYGEDTCVSNEQMAPSLGSGSVTLNRDIFNAWTKNLDGGCVGLFKANADVLLSAMTYDNFWLSATSVKAQAEQHL